MNGSENEERSPQDLVEEDPELRWAFSEEDLGSEGGEEGGAGGGTGEGRRETPRTPAIDEAAQRALDRLKDPAVLDRLLAPAPVVQPPGAREVVQEQRKVTFNPSEIAAQVEKDFAESPQKGFETLIRSMGQAALSFQQENDKRIVQANLSAADSAIDRYLDNLRADPRFDDDVVQEMRAITDRARQTNPQVIANMTGQQIREALDAAQAEAYGRVMLRRNKPRQVAPQYGAPRGGRASSAPTNRREIELTQDERAFCRSLEQGLRGAGLTQKEIDAAVRQSLREYREEQAS